MMNQTIETTDISSSDSYQLIKDEHLSFVVITSQILAGSRVLLSTYQQVVFSDCSFYACEFQGVTFKDCVFDNCTFEFSHFRKCQFVNCSFNNCTWSASHSIDSVYNECDMSANRENELEERGNTMIYKENHHTTDIYFELSLTA